MKLILCQVHAKLKDITLSAENEYNNDITLSTEDQCNDYIILIMGYNCNIYSRAERMCYYCLFVKGAPTILRADRGTENTNIAFLQPFLRDGGDDSFAKEKSFMYGRSTSNQVSLKSKCILDLVHTCCSVLKHGGDSCVKMQQDGGWIILRFAHSVNIL